MWPFSTEPRECSNPSSEYRAGHRGPFIPRRELGKWRANFDPIAHDDEYVYGYVEENPYSVCDTCGNKVKLGTTVIEREFEKVRKSEINEADLEQIEVTLDRLKMR